MSSHPSESLSPVPPPSSHLASSSSPAATRMSCAIRSNSLTSLEALADLLPPSQSPSRAPSLPPAPLATASPSLARLVSARAADKQHEVREEESDLPYLTLANEPFLPPPPRPTLPNFVKTASKLRKAPPVGMGYKRLSGKKPEGGAGVKERSGMVGRRTSGGGKSGKRWSKLGLGCRREEGATMLEKGYGVGWGEEQSGEGDEGGEKVASSASRRPPFATMATSSSLASKASSAHPRRLANIAQHRASSGSDRSFVWVSPQQRKRSSEKGWEIYRDGEDEVLSSEEEKEEGEAPKSSSAPISDAETSGENAFRRPPLPSFPRLPLHPQQPSTHAEPPKSTKHFKLPTLPSPPIGGGPAVLLLTPAGLTDVSFDLTNSHDLPSSPESARTFVEHDGAEAGPFASPIEELNRPFEEGFAAFRLEEHDQREQQGVHEQEISQGTSGAWLNDLLADYERSSDTVSLASSSSDSAPLGQKYPHRTSPLLATFPSFPSIQQPYPSPSLHPHSATPTSHSFFPFPAGSPAFFHSSASSAVTPSRSSPTVVVPSRRPPTPLIDLSAPPPSPAWLTQSPVSPPLPTRAPAKKKPSLIGFVQGRALPDKPPVDPMKRWREAERKRAATAAMLQQTDEAVRVAASVREKKE